MNLLATPEEVAHLTRRQREERVRSLIRLSHRIVDAAERNHFHGRRLAATVALFSGGDDSTTLAHLFRDRIDFAAHANTGIGIEQTRQFVRQTCADWGVPLLERHPPAGDTYRDLVLSHGFPGPGQHFKMYQRLKERCLRQVRNELVTQPYRERVLFLAGRRRSESARRTKIPASERTGSIVWVSPLVIWTKMDLNTYRLMNDVPVNAVSDLIHMSGECLCGSFAQFGELEEVGYWFPEVRQEIEALEAEIADRVDIPEARRKWGWGAYRSDLTALMARSRSGALCSSCEERAAALCDGGSRPGCATF